MNPKNILKWAGLICGLIMVTFILFLICYVTYKPIHRYQKRADIKNQVKVTHSQIKVAKQQVKVERQHALVQQQIGRGQKLQNEEIAKKLNPLFVQYSMIEALKAVAASGQNNTVVYIPVGANGVPLVSLAGTQVYGGQSEPK